MTTVVLRSAEGAEARVSLYGGQVTSWKTFGGDDALFLSSKAVFAPGKAIRGGIPVCFPQFSDMGPVAASHGFARTSMWRVAGQTDDSVTMELPADDEQRARLREVWPHDFVLSLTTTLQRGDTLMQTMEVANVGSEPFAFTTCLHTYLRVDTAAVSVAGLSGLPFMDNTAARAVCAPHPDGEEVSIAGEVDRIYLGGGSREVSVRGGGRTVRVRAEGFPDMVLWCPWADKAKSMADFGDDEYLQMLCVEPAVAGSGPITLPPGQRVSLQQTITVTPH